MGIAFTCPQCGQAFRVADAAAGKKARCKRCGLSMQVPTVSGEDPLIFATEVDDGPPPPAPRSRSVPGFDVYGLEEAAAADPGFEVLPDDEPELVPVSRSVRGVSRRRTGWKVAGGIAAAAGLVLVVGLAGAWLMGTGSRLSEPPPAPSVLPALPGRGVGREVGPGVFYHEVVLGPGGARPGVPPGHGMTLWLYLPAGAHAPRSLPCVLIAPAGSILITGNELSSGEDGDHPEHLPWVRAGFAVLAYGLDGNLSDDAPNQLEAVREASSAFRAARAGLTNAQVALAWLAARVPEVDPDRVYTAGHSSAGTMALLLAEHDRRVKGCVAFAPRSDVKANFNFTQRLMLRGAGVSWLDEFFSTYDPKVHAAELKCPVFLFHARDDSVVPVSETEAFAAQLERLGTPVSLVTVDTGGHYQAMVREGIPRAIAWLRGVDGRR